MENQFKQLFILQHQFGD